MIKKFQLSRESGEVVMEVFFYTFREWIDEEDI